MPDYDFHQLSPLDFEQLARDLFAAEEGLALESFKAGKDQGMDFRYARGPDKVIGQCKHYLRTGLDGLLQSVKVEAPKVVRLDPSRYVFATSVPLSPDDKDRIRDLIGAQYLASGDIWGPAELNERLGRHEGVEKAHYKLWLASTAVLERVLHNDVATQSEFAVRRVHRDIKRYVQSQAYPRALAMLTSEKVAILSGLPGVGKTTLARMLLYAHLEEGYQAVVIRRDIAEGQKLLKPDTRQIFFFDDFMGATFLGEHGSPLERNGDQAILDFVEMVRDSPNARLVLTTREHILGQAFNVSERMRHSDLRLRRVTLMIGDYSAQQRAQILYNHIHFSDLPRDYRDVLLAGDFYLEILKHPKFNPRLIEWLSDHQRLRGVAVGDYKAFVRRLLADPTEIWLHAYRRQLSDAGRSLLLALFSYDGRAQVGVLRRAFAALHRRRGQQGGFKILAEDFADAVAELMNAFIRPVGGSAFEVIDPSVIDLMNTVVSRHPENAIDLAAGAVDLQQIERLWTFSGRFGRTTVLPVLRDQVELAVPALRQTLLSDRRREHDGSVFYFGMTFERRMALILTLWRDTPGPALADLVKPTFDRLCQEWLTERVELEDAAQAYEAVEASGLLTETDQTAMLMTIRDAALKEARTGARPDQLRVWISALDLEQDGDAEARAALAAGYEIYRNLWFDDDLRERSSLQDYEQLIDDLVLFRRILGVDVDGPLNAAETAKSDFEEAEDAYADHQQDVWKEQHYEARAAERDVRDMFASLRED